MNAKMNTDCYSKLLLHCFSCPGKSNDAEDFEESLAELLGQQGMMPHKGLIAKKFHEKRSVCFDTSLSNTQPSKTWKLNFFPIVQIKAYLMPVFLIHQGERHEKRTGKHFDRTQISSTVRVFCNAWSTKFLRAQFVCDCRKRRVGRSGVSIT